MNAQETTEIRELTSDELDGVSGGVWWLAGLFAIGVAIGYAAGPSMGGDYNVVLPAYGT
jgi:lactobin A/cerein 7B family class IIb bacteriocin